MSKPANLPERVTNLEKQMSEVDRKADDALTLARGADHDVSDVRVELRAHRKLLNILREDQLDLRSEMREGFSKVGVGMAQITALLTIRQEKSDDEPGLG